MYAVRLTFMSGPDDGREIWLKSNQGLGQAIRDGWEFIVGRHKSCDLGLPFDTQASRTHAALRIQSTGLLLADLDSRNGVYWADQRVSGSVPLHVGDLFRVGYTWLRVEEIVL